MARRAVEEINAGSMADIAFLLLIFFLVTTTMDTDEGIVRTLPQKIPDNVKIPPIDVHARDVFEVLANANDNLLVENEYIDISELREKTKEFLTNPTNSPDLPEMLEVSETYCKKRISEIEALMSAEPTSDYYTIWKSELDDVKGKLAAVQKVGPYRSLPKMAIISLRNDNNTSYKLYVDVQNELQSAIDELRNEWSMKVYGENYTEWDPAKEEHKPKIEIIRSIVPQRIAEQQPKNIPAF